MTEQDAWSALGDEIARWREAGRMPRFWLRDDDAIEPTEALDSLLEVTRRYHVPLALAVIPQGAGPALAKRLARESHVRALVHGWAHANHAPSGEKKQELGAHRPAEIVLSELRQGLEKLTALFGPVAAPVLVPPWNRIDKALIPQLPGLGFTGLSVFGKPFAAPLAIVNSTVDIMDWHGTRGCRDHAAIIGEILSALRHGFDNPAEPPIGLLTHHLVHDGAAWAFMERLFEVASDAQAASWLSIDEAMASAVSMRG
jgi:hypothetical protein